MMTNNINFSEVFAERKNLVVVFGDEFNQNYRLTSILLTIVGQFKEIQLYYTDFQYDLFKWLLQDQDVTCLNITKAVAPVEHSVVIALASDKNTERFYRMLNKSVLVGMAKNTNFSLIPEPKESIEICTRTFDSIGVKYYELGDNLDQLVEKHFDSELQEQELELVLDINNMFNKLLINRASKSWREYLAMIQCSSAAEGKGVISGGGRSENRDFSLKEILEYAMKSKRVVTDDKDFFGFLNRFPFKYKVYYLGKMETDKEISVGQLKELYTRKEQ
ncbi:MAG: hypothetical protein WCX83_02520 [Candidatus Cloacimonas sp.]